MENKILVRDATIVNEGKIFTSDILIEGGNISRIGSNIGTGNSKVTEIDASGKHLFPGLIDDQVHFREPGLTHKGEIYTESAAAVAGGVTSYMEMPNTVPGTLTQELLADKYKIGAAKSFANYSFYMGASNDNLDEVLKTDRSNVCGIKIFMGSSTGNMLVDNEAVLEKIFAGTPLLVATHCEDESTVRERTEYFRNKYGEDLPPAFHSLVRNEEACFLSSSRAVALATKHNSRLHILHISTAKETNLFTNKIPLKQKRITSEACIHHLWFDDRDYEKLGNRIKWNPSVKTEKDKEGIWAALLDDRIDVIATDHAPHTIEEKSKTYFNAPSGGPLIQHSLVALLEMHRQGKISLEKIIEKAVHAVADCFHIRDRGYIREGYKADLVLVDMNAPWEVKKENLLYKCGWSPFEGQVFQSKVETTFVNGNIVYSNGKVNEAIRGERLLFDHNS